MSWVVGVIIGGAIAGAIAYPSGVSKGKADYENKKEVLRERLLSELPTIPVPDWINLPDVLNWLKTCPSEDVLKWAIQALNQVIDQYETQSQFILALLNSLKTAFQVPPTLAPSPRIKRKLQKVVAKEVKTAITAPIII